MRAALSARFPYVLLATLAASFLAGAPSRADIDWPTAEVIKKLQMKKVDLKPFTLTYSPRWQFLADYLAKSKLPSDFLDYIKKEYGMAYAPFAPNKQSNNQPDTPLISAFLFPDLASFQAEVNNPAFAAALGGVANPQFASVRLDPAYTPPADLKGEGMTQFIESRVLPVFLHEAFHVVSLRECAKLITHTPNPDFGDVSAEFLGPMWFAEGFPDSIPMAISPAARAAKYKAFYSYFADKKWRPKFADLYHAFEAGDVAKMAMVYLMGSMTVEYLRLKMGTATIRKLFEFGCRPHKSIDEYLAGRKAIQGGSDDDELWTKVYEHFESHRADYLELLK